MRFIPSYILDKLKMSAQTRANGSAITSSVWVTRPTTQLTDPVFLEKQIVPTVKNGALVDVSLATRHSSLGDEYDETYIGYIYGTTLTVMHSDPAIDIDSHIWITSETISSATRLTLAFNGEFKKATKTSPIQFISEEVPWLFWISGGVLNGKRIGSEEIITLSDTNVTDVAAVRGFSPPDNDALDFGFIVFYIIEGSIYYRQLINGEWYEAINTNFGPSGITFSEISASRSWDYRIILQAKGSDGKVYELFTQFMGIGRNLAEHIDLSDISITTDLIEVDKPIIRESEHIDITNIEPNVWVSSPINRPSIIGAYNVDTDGDWGKKAVFIFDQPINPTSAVTQVASFEIVDSRGIVYNANNLTVSRDRKTLYLEYADFNNARGVVKAVYRPGTVYDQYGALMIYTEFDWTPVNLVPSEIPVPKVEDIWNE